MIGRTFRNTSSKLLILHHLDITWLQLKIVGLNSRSGNSLTKVGYGRSTHILDGSMVVLSLLWWLRIVVVIVLGHRWWFILWLRYKMLGIWLWWVLWWWLVWLMRDNWLLWWDVGLRNLMLIHSSISSFNS